MSHEEHLTVLKGELVDDIRHTAEWRESKAEEYPEDDRNEAAVQSLNECDTRGVSGWREK